MRARRWSVARRRSRTRTLSALCLATVFAMATLTAAPAGTALAAGASEFSGVVVDAGGVGLSGVSLTLVDGAGDSFNRVSGADGSFSFVVNSGVYPSLTVTGSGLGSGVGYQFGWTSLDLSGSATGQSLVLPALIPVTVRVTDPSGAPVAGGSVSADFSCSSLSSLASLGGVPAGSGNSNGGTANTVDGSGSVTFTDLPCAAGSAAAPSFQASASGFVTSGSISQGAATSATTVPITLAVAPPARTTFSGVVVNETGQPLSGVQVLVRGRIFGGSVTTGSDGRFSMTVEPRGYGLTVSPASSVGCTPWCLSSGLDMTHDLTGQTITIPSQQGPLTLAVTDPAGAPVPGVSVTAPGSSCTKTVTIMPGVQGTLYGNDPALNGTTDPAGQLPAGSYASCTSLDSVRFHLQPPTGSGLAEEYIPAPHTLTGPTTLPITVYSVSGTLTSAGGAPLAGQSLTLTASSGSTPVAGAAALRMARRTASTQQASTSPTTYQAITNAVGFFGLPAVPAGNYVITLSGTGVGSSVPHSYSVSTDTSVAVAPGSVLTLSLPVVHATIVVVDQTGAPLPGAQVSIPCAPTSLALGGTTGSGSSCGSGTTDSTGTADVAMLPSSSVDVVVTPPTGSTWSGMTLHGVDLSSNVSKQVMLKTLTSLKVGPSSASVAAGKTLQFNATGTYSDGTTQDLTSAVNWTSSSAAVATISSAGLLMAKTSGSTTITATLSGVSGSSTFTVLPPALTSVAVSAQNPTIVKHTSQQFTATGTYSDGSAQNLTSQVTWTSSSTAVATINSVGLATGKTKGSTTITATLSGVSGSAALTVVAPVLTSLKVTPGSASLAAGKTVHFTATGTYSDGSTQNLTSDVAWTSSSTAVATINSVGLATGKTKGSASVTAALTGVSAIATITVK